MPDVLQGGEEVIGLEPPAGEEPPTETPPQPALADETGTYALTAEGAALKDRPGSQVAGAVDPLGELGNFYVTNDDRVVQFVALSPDNSVGLAGVADMVCVLNVRKGEGMYRFLGHRAAVRAGCFSADGSLALTGDDSGDVFLWEVASGKVVRHFELHDGPVHQVACAHACALGLSVGADGVVRLLNLKRGTQLYHAEVVGAGTSVAFSPDDALIATGTSTGKVRIWQTQELRPLQELRNAPPGQIASVRFASDGLRVLAAGIQTGWGSSWAHVTRWQRRPGSAEPYFRRDSHCKFRNMRAVAFASSGDILVGGGGPEQETSGTFLQTTRAMIASVLRSAAGFHATAEEGRRPGETQWFTPFKIASVPLGRVLRAYPGHMRTDRLATITCVNVGASGRGISGGDDGRVQIWGIGWA